MKISLIVASPDKMDQKAFTITRPCFVIGREADCQLRPASDMVSKRHCALLVDENAAFVDDLGSTNGTFLNDQPVRDKTELHDQDSLRVGPLLFTVRLEAGSLDLPKQQQQAAREMADEELAAALLLSMPDKPKRRFQPESGDEIAPPLADTGVEPGTTQSVARVSEPKEKDPARDTAKSTKRELAAVSRAARGMLMRLERGQYIEATHRMILVSRFAWRATAAAIARAQSPEAQGRPDQPGLRIAGLAMVLVGVVILAVKYRIAGLAWVLVLAGVAFLVLTRDKA
jgi:pSer/pThr/pTyr-binding forkhead associated (FHA) protein